MSSTPTSTSEPDLRRLEDCTFFRAFAAHSGVGLIRSNCRRNLRSYSGPVTISSEGASRSFRSRLCAVRDICKLASSGSVHAGALRGRRGASPGEGVWPVIRTGVRISLSLACGE